MTLARVQQWVQLCDSADWLTVGDWKMGNMSRNSTPFLGQSG